MKSKLAMLLLGGLFITSAASAQIQWGVKAGGNLSGMLVKSDNGYERVKLRPGFHLGGTADVKITDQFFLQPALLFTTKGFAVDNKFPGFSDVDKVKFTSNYLELPINLLFKPQVGSGRLIIGVGPYIAYALGGKWKATKDNYSVSGKLKFTSDIDSSYGSPNNKTIPYTKPFDFGANLLIGYEINNNLYLHLNGQLGLLNIEPSYFGVRDNRSSMKTAQGGLSVGYRFGGK